MILNHIYRTLYKSKYYVVKQNCCHRWLAQHDGTIHTRINRWAIYKPSLEYMIPMLWLCNQDPGSYLMLGLGGGAILHSLEHKLTHSHFDAVEINPEIINIARRFFYLDTLTSSKIIEEDANCYIRKCQKQYDSLLIDLYQDKAYPTHCATRTFFQHCQRLLKPHGMLMINCANMSQYRFLLNQLREVFNQSVLTIRVSNPRNVILITANQSLQALIDKLPLMTLLWHSDTGAVGDLSSKSFILRADTICSF